MPLESRLHAFLFAAGLTVLTSTVTAAASNIDDLVPQNLPITFSGSYLAGRAADFAKDIGSAVAFYDEAIESDPENPALIDRLLLLSLADGAFDRAFQHAETLVEIDSSNATARMALAARAFREGDFEAAATQLEAASAGPLSALIAGLMAGWADFGQGNVDDALARIDALTGPTWYRSFKAAHTALVLDATGRPTEALPPMAGAYEADQSLAMVQGFARILARAGMADDAMAVLMASAGGGPLDPSLQDLFADIEAGVELAPVISDATAGAAQVLFDLGAALGTDDGPEQAAAYLQMARYLVPGFTLAKRYLGRIHQGAGRCEDAIAIFDSIPADDTLRRDADIQIGICLSALERHDEAVEYTMRVVEADPADWQAASALGDVYRRAGRFADAAEAYTRAIGAIGTPTTAHWRIVYDRARSYVFSDEWPKAEADFLLALELNPDQAEVLNFLGYSWVDMGLNLDDGLDMVKRAVELRPQAGYIVDSLGWAYFRLGRYEDAVTQLERAIELQPFDSTLYEHLGDAYWMVGRKREAVFQWNHALDFDPAEGDVEKIQRKIENGLDQTDLVRPASAPPG